jgi:DNA/RNA-binding domain of Phe-tRNA-synthetase-like protein
MSSSSPGGEAGEPREGWLAPEVEQELSGLRLLSCELEVRKGVSLSGDSPAGVQGRLHELSNRVRGPRAIGIRREPVPAAYRAFYRHIGLDPDVERTPIEDALMERMMRGGFPTAGLLEDVLTISLMDTGVPVWALDAQGLAGTLGIRSSLPDEPLGSSPDAPLLPSGRLVVADERTALAVLFGERASERVPGPRCARLLLFSVQVAGVPSLYVEEALWSARSALEAA